MKYLFSLFILGLASMPNLTHAEERIELEQTTVTGNRELPKITHIVPWQAAQLAAPEPPPLDHLIDGALLPLDRHAFRRRILYYYELFSSGTTAEVSSGTGIKPLIPYE